MVSVGTAKTGDKVSYNFKDFDRSAFVTKITAWRRNFDPAPLSDTISANKLRAKIGALRSATGKQSRKDCWTITYAIIAGTMTYRNAVAQFGIDTKRAAQIWKAENAQPAP